MRTVVAIAALLIIVLLPVSALAWSLVSDPNLSCVGAVYDVEVNGTIVTVPARYSAEIDGSIRYNIDHLGTGQKIFRLQCYHSSGWGSGWSDPLDATKPGSPGNARIVKDATD